MKVGDLVKFRENGVLGLILERLDNTWGLFRVQWFDGDYPVQARYAEEMEVVSASR